MCANPYHQVVLRQVAGRQCEKRGHHLGIARIERVAVDPEEGHHRQEPDTLVAIPVWMVAHQPEGIGGGEYGYVNVFPVVPVLLRAGQGRLEDVPVAHTGQASVLAKLISVDGVDHESGQPPGLVRPLRHGYLASSRSAFRYFLAAWAATFSARSVSGA